MDVTDFDLDTSEWQQPREPPQDQQRLESGFTLTLLL